MDKHNYVQMNDRSNLWGIVHRTAGKQKWWGGAVESDLSLGKVGNMTK